ncbi:hypothetical protein [Kosakonia radicincitans]|uniref:hypothetical protein n=1 Tax=Kosakonia radicincitans TaxID=283686 RepID=UPI001D08897B|nr:hypothetical protein [Kosakonia radicincitans]
MAVTIALTQAQIANLVNNNASLQAAVIAAYVESNSAKLSISDLTVTTDSISVDATAVDVTAGQTNTVNITSSGDSDISVESSDQAIVTGSVTGGVLTVAGEAAGTAVLTLKKGTATATVSVSVSAAS